VDFVDDKNLVSTLGGSIANVLSQFPDFIDSAIRRSIDLDDIDRRPAGDLLTGFTLIAGVDSGAGLAIQGFRQDPGRGGLSDSSGPSEQKGVCHSLLGNRVLQRLGNVTLPDDILKDLGSPFSGKDEIRHDLLFEV
jgi:hypothetical protein